MTVTEIKDLMQQMEDAGHGDSEVLFTYQDNYPLQDHIKGGWIPEESDADSDDEDEDQDSDDCPANTVYLVSGGQCSSDPYGPSRAFREAVECL
jgi:hypothetical protein